MSISFCKAPLAKILKLGSEADFEKVTSNCKFYMTFKNNPFPKVSSSVIRSLREKGNDKSATAQLLHNVNFCFPLITQTVSEIAATEQGNANNEHYCSVFLLFSFVSWYGSFTKTGRTYPAHIVFNSLMTIKEESLKVLTISAIYTGLTAVLQIASIPLFEGYFDTLKKFFSVYGEVLPPQSGRLFGMVLDHFKDKTEEKAVDVWGLICEVANQHPNVFDQETVDKLLDILTPLVGEKRKVLFGPFGSLMKLADQSLEKYEILVRNLCEQLVNWVVEDSVEMTIPEPSDCVLVLSGDPGDVQGTNFSDVTFPNGFSAKPKVNVSATTSENVFKEYEPLVMSIRDELQLVAILYQKLNQVQADKDPSAMCLMSFVFYAIELYNAPSGPTVISNTAIFRPSITVFTDMNPELSAIRNQGLRILTGYQDELAKFVKEIQIYPLLFAEIMYRLAVMKAPLNQETLASALSYYRAIDLSATENREEIELARASIFTVIEVLRPTLFEDLVFMTDYYLIHLFEKGLQEYILSELCVFVRSVDIDMRKLPMSALSSFLEKCVKQCEGDASLADLLALILTSVLNSMDPSENGEFLSPIFRAILGYLKNNLVTNEFFDLFIKCMSVASPHFHLSQNEAALLISSKNFVNRENTEKLYEQMCSLMSYDGKTCENPNLINALFVLYEDINVFSPYIAKLLTVESNVQVMHRSDVDVFLIQKFQEEREKGNLDKTKLLLKMIESIAAHASSPSVAADFISLLAPNSDGKLYDTELALIESLDHLVMIEHAKQSYFSNIESCGSMSAEVQVNGGLRVNGWIFFVEPDDKCFRFFKISYPNGFVKTELDGLEWKITFHNEDEEVEKRMKTNLFTKQWNFVVVTIEKDALVFSVNLSDSRTMNLPVPLPESVEVIVGTEFLTKIEKDNNIVAYYSVSTGSEESTLEQIYQGGPAMMSDEKCIVSTLQTRNLGYIDARSQNMVSCLLRQWGFDLLMPIFSILDMSFVSGAKYEMTDLAFDILEKSLVFNCELQSNFVETKKIEILSYLVYTRRAIHTYNIYLKLFKIFRSVINKELKSKLVDLILMNSEIWTHADPEDNLLITQHWSNHLFACAKPIVLAVRPFCRMLYEMNIYYSYDRSRLNVEECRNAITGLLVRIAQSSLTKEDVTELINQCVKTKDPKAVDDLLILLRLLATNPYIKLSSTRFDVASAVRLTQLVEKGVVSNCISLLQTLMEFFKQNIVPYEILPQLIQIILLRMKSFAVANDVFFRSTVSEIALSSPYVASICCWYAAAVDENCQSALLDHFERVGFPDIVTSPVTMFWPMVLAIKGKDSERMFNVIAKRSGDNWMWVLPATEIVASVISSDVGDAQLMALRSLLGALSKTPANVKRFFIFAAFLVLYQQNQSMNSGLLKMMLASPFADEIDPVSLNPRVERQIKDYTILDGLRFESENKFTYGLRIDENLVWKDAEFVADLLVWVGNEFKEFQSVVSLLNELLSHRSSCSVSEQSQGLAKSQSMERISHIYTNSIGDLKKFEEVYLSVREKYIESFRGDVFKTRSLLKEQGVGSVKGVLETVCGSIANKIELCHDEWARFWTAVSVSKAPWDCHDMASKQYWKRSASICSYFCPIRLVRMLRKCQRIQYQQSLSYGQTVGKAKRLGYMESMDDSVFEKNCVLVRPKGVADAMLAITKQFMTITRGQSVSTIPLCSISYILRRAIYHIPSALEIITRHNSDLLLDFAPGDVEEVIEKLAKAGCGVRTMIQRKPAMDFIAEIGVTKRWASGQCSNFEYLMKLNIWGGRSFNNLSQYPVFPWILADYTTDTLDLQNEAIFRDLSKPIGVLDEGNAAKAQIRYDVVENNEPRFMYNTAPLCPAAIFYYLMRIEPFSTMYMNWDNEEKPVFESVGECFKQACTSFERGNWELCPEFFCQPEIFDNQSSFGLEGGTCSSAALPKWASSPIEFVYLHRKALESPYVSQHLHEWIDLMFGCKQRSVESMNVYKADLYELLCDKKNLEEKALEVKPIVQSLGRVPNLLFKEPHPRREISKVQQTGELLNVNCGFACVYIGIRQDILYVVDKAANINQYSFDLKAKTCNLVSQTPIQDNFLKATLEQTADNVKFIPTGNTFCAIVIDGLGYQRVSYDDGKATLVEPPGGVKAGSGSGQYIIINSKEQLQTSVYEGDKLCVAIRQYRSVATCCDISQQFSVSVIGTKDGALIVNSVPSGVTSRVIDLGNAVPLQVMITDAFGFIVALVKEVTDGVTKHYLVTYTINGVFVRKAELDGELLLWTKSTSFQSFDYLAYVLKQRVDNDDVTTIYECEAFYLKPRAIPFHPKSRIVSLKYTQSHDCYVIAQADGHVTFLAHDRDE